MSSLSSLVDYASSDDERDNDSDAGQPRSICRASEPDSAAELMTTADTVSTVDVDEQNRHLAPDDRYTDVVQPSLPSNSSSSLFSSLPAPRAKQSITIAEEPLENKVDKAPKLAKRQIVIPKLSELDDKDDVGEPKPKRLVFKSSTGSGLLTMLPPPASRPARTGSKTTLTQMAPHSLGKKVQPPMKVKPNITPKTLRSGEAKESEEKQTVEKKVEGAEEGNDDGAGPSAFFSFDEPKLSDEQLKGLITAEDLQPRRIKLPSSPPVGPALPFEFEVNNDELEQQPAVDSSTSHGISEEVLLQLRGRRHEKIELFSIDAADFTAEARSNLTKNLTVEDTRPAPVEGNEPSRLHKSKHHITHLAFQAKARENELKNQWAANRMTKRETQRKYGF